METQVYDALKEALAKSEVKVKIGDEEKSLFDMVVYWEEGVAKTKEANKDLTQQREGWENKEKEYKKNISEIAEIKTKLEQQLQEKDGSTKKKSQETEELQRMINAQNEKIDQLNKAHEESQKKITEANERAKSANKKASEESLRKELITELSEHKIIGTQADFAVEIIFAKGFAKVTDNEAGFYERSICTVKDGKPLAADLKTLCKWIAEQHQFLVSSSGKPGTGMQHQSGNPSKSGNTGNYYGMISKK